MRPERSEDADGEAATSVVSPFEALPGLTTAFDEERMKGHLGAALFGDVRARHRVEHCTPTRPLYIPGDFCMLRYRFRATDETGAVLEPIVTARVFPNRSACASYMEAKLVALAARMHDRPETAAFVTPAAMIDALNMVVHVWPVDGELPTLVDATDRRLMLDVFRETLPGSLEERYLVDDCHVELVSYRRRQRCVLRYTIAGRATGRDETRSLIVYGKVTAVGDETLNSRMLHALRAAIVRPAAIHQLTLPRPLGTRPDLGLSLLEALPGDPMIGPALKARLRGRPVPGAVPLEEMIATCGYVAATLHGSGVALGRTRTFDDELSGLQHQVAMAGQFAPSFGDRARSWLERISTLASRSEPLTPRLCHGDFKHEQLLFDGARSGLVDFDGICQAEPALDLGKFLAHLRVDAERIQRRASVSSPLGDELAERFLGAYVGAAGDDVEDEPRLRIRAMLYEAIALLRLALISQLDLDRASTEMMSTLLEARISGIER